MRARLRPFRRDVFLRSRRRAAEVAWRGAALAVRRRPTAREMAGKGAEPACRYAAAARRRRQGALFLCRPRELADPDRRAQHPDRSGMVERGSPFSFAGPKRHNDPGIAFDALPPIDVVLVSHGHYDHLDLATLSKLAAKFTPRVITPLGNDVTMRERRRRHPRRGVRLARPCRARQRRRRDAGADAALVGARPVRPQQGAMGEFRAGDAGRQALHRLRFRLWRRQAFPPGRARRTVRCGSRSCRSAPMSRAGSCGPAHEPGGRGEGAGRLRRRAGAGHHYGTFQLTDEAIDAPVRRSAWRSMRRTCRAKNLSVLKPGKMFESFVVPAFAGMPCCYCSFGLIAHAVTDSVSSPCATGADATMPVDILRKGHRRRIAVFRNAESLSRECGYPNRGVCSRG